jgi:hypothetical protein
MNRKKDRTDAAATAIDSAALSVERIGSSLRE